ncbi:MAG: potassium transporter [Acidobacteria bacterium]|nr:MAG: potassium transporter [Acidobacteriota bacterium]REK07727.1 MAG: potassium transporter [Acidobacteriota bacterium]
MHGQEFFTQAFVYLLAGVVSVPIAKRLGLGSVLGYLIAGVAIGPFALGLVAEEGEDVLHFAEFGVVMMLFLIGLELRPQRLWRMRAQILGLGGVQILLSAVLLGAAAWLAFGDLRQGIAIGLVLALSSTAIVLQTMQEKGLMSTEAGESSFSVLLAQDIAVIPMLAMLPLLALRGGGDGAPTHASGHAADGHGAAEGAHAGSAFAIESLPIWGRGLVVFAAVALIFVAGRYLLRPVFRFIARARLREIFTGAALLLVIGIALLMAQVGLSPALGTFLAGVVLANSEYRHELESSVEPFKGLLLGLFFISVGAAVDFELVGGALTTVAGAVVVLVVAKIAVLLLLARFFRLGLDQALLFAFSLAQGSEFAFVLFSFAVQSQVLPAELAETMVAAVALSMALTPLLMLFAERVLLPRVGTAEAEERESDVEDDEAPVLIAGFGRVGQIVERLLTAQGIRSTVLDFDSDQVELLRGFGNEVYYGDATRLDLLRAAGAERARLIVLAVDRPATQLKLVHRIREHFPHLRIVARARSRTDAYDLIDAGADDVFRETFDSALQMGIRSLERLGVRSYRAHRLARAFRQFDEKSLRRLLQLRKDRTAYVGAARRQREDLALVLERDVELLRDPGDPGWDVESLAAESREGSG